MCQFSYIIWKNHQGDLQMKTNVPCPQCEIPITLKDFQDFSSPFTMRCPHCLAKLKETRVTPFLLILLIGAIPLFIFLTDLVQQFLAGFFPFVAKLPSVLIFLFPLFPVFMLYERFNGLIMFNMGNLRMKHTYESFWDWFLKHEDVYYQLEEDKLDRAFGALMKQLSRYSPALVFEFSVDPIADKREFTISANGNLILFPAVEKLVDAAPPLERFKLIKFHQREETDIRIHDVQLTAKDLFFTYTWHDEILELKVYIKGWDEEDETYFDAACLFLESLVGEYDLVMHVENVEFYQYEENAFLKPIAELPALVDELKNEKLQPQD